MLVSQVFLGIHSAIRIEVGLPATPRFYWNCSKNLPYRRQTSLFDLEWVLTNPIGQGVAVVLVSALILGTGRKTWKWAIGRLGAWRGRVQASRHSFSPDEAKRVFGGYGESEARRLLDLKDQALPAVVIDLSDIPGEEAWRVPVSPDTLGWELALAVRAHFGRDNFYRLNHRPTDRELPPDRPVSDTAKHGDGIVALANGGVIWGITPKPGLLGRFKRFWWRFRRPDRRSVEKVTQ